MLSAQRGGTAGKSARRLLHFVCKANADSQATGNTGAQDHCQAATTRPRTRCSQSQAQSHTNSDSQSEGKINSSTRCYARIHSCACQNHRRQNGQSPDWQKQGQINRSCQR